MEYCEHSIQVFIKFLHSMSGRLPTIKFPLEELSALGRLSLNQADASDHLLYLSIDKVTLMVPI